MMDTEERRLAILELTERAIEATTAEERDEAKRQLAKVGSDWRGFPGQRRRGEFPVNVCVR